MTYRIESDIPLPDSGANGSKRRYPFDALAPGQSFAVPFTEGPHRRAVIQRIATAIHRRHRKGRDGETAPRFTWKAGDTHLRVWRVS